MKLLITGAWGNLGVMCVEQALADGYDLRCFDLASATSQRIAQHYQQKYPQRIETVWGDITALSEDSSLLAGIDGVIHNASVLPPFTENHPLQALRINVKGTQKLIDLAEQTGEALPFVFPSSVTVFGKPSTTPSIKSLSDTPTASDNYTRHKLTCEALLQQSLLNWSILRVGVSVDSRTTTTDISTLKSLLRVHPENSLEYVHPRDVALAMCKAISTPEAHKKILLIGGGTACRVTQAQFINAALTSCGLQLKQHSFGSAPYYTHWMDTEESQRLLNYQHHTFSDYQQEMHTAMKRVRYAVLPMRPLANWLLNLWVSKLSNA